MSNNWWGGGREEAGRRGVLNSKKRERKKGSCAVLANGLDATHCWNACSFNVNTVLGVLTS